MPELVQATVGYVDPCNAELTQLQFAQAFRPLFIGEVSGTVMNTFDKCTNPKFVTDEYKVQRPRAPVSSLSMLHLMATWYSCAEPLRDTPTDLLPLSSPLP